MSTRYPSLMSCLMAAMLLTGCTSSLSDKVTRNPTAFGQPDATATVEVSQEYRIGSFDELKVVIFQVPDLSGPLTVDSTGSINVPLVGEVEVAGLTPREVKAKLEGLYGARYLKSPQVSVSVEKAVSQRVTVDGAVAQPGVYPITGPTTLMQAVALARGTKEDALLSRVVVFRRINGQRQAAAFDLREIRRGSLDDPAIYGDDVIVVDGSSLRRNIREAIGTIPILAIFNPLG